MELELVLEYVDIETLLNCLFLNKRIHKIVYSKLQPDICLLWQMDDIFYGDMYEGIQFIGRELRGGDTDFILRLSRKSPELRKRLMAIYMRLYPFYTVTKNHEYRYAYDGILNILDDFADYIEKYYLPYDVIRLLIREAFKHKRYEWIIKCVLDKGFNVNQLMKIHGNYKTTILLYAVKHERLDIIDLVLDYKPDLYMFDATGHSAVSAVKKYLYIKCREEHESVLASIKEKYDALKAQQFLQREHNVWRSLK